MGVILLYDKNIAQDTSKADVAMSITATDDINIRIKELADIIQSNPKTAVEGWSNALHIVCNSAAEGLQLGQLINHQNVAEIFSPLRFKVGSIIIHGCGAAVIYRAANNGFLMCQRLANIVFANVTASDCGSLFSKRQQNEAYGRWQGKVATWNQFGKISMLQEYNNEGEFMRNIHEPFNSVVKYFKRTIVPVQSNKQVADHSFTTSISTRLFNFHRLLTAMLL